MFSPSLQTGVEVPCGPSDLQQDRGENTAADDSVEC